MNYLSRRVTEETRTQEYETIASFMKENQALEEELIRYQQVWDGSITMANNVIQAIRMIRKSLVTVDRKAAGSEEKWLAFWGIYKEYLGEPQPWI
jgi:hypothetical protein